MAATKVGIVYATNSGILRRWIVPDNDSDLIQHHPVAPGETMLLVDRAQIPANPAQATPFILSAVARNSGIANPPSARCAVVDAVTGLVVSAIMADPALDAIDGHTLMLHPAASVGWCLLTNGNLVNPNAPVLNAAGAQIGVAGIPAGTSVAGSFVPPIGTAVPVGGAVGA